MSSLVSIAVVVSMLGQTLLGVLAPPSRIAPPSTLGRSQPASPAPQNEADPCLVIAYETYLPIVMRSNGISGNSADTVAPISSSANTSGLKGRVLDANDAANGIETPLIGVTVCSLETGLSVKTDANGEFTLTGLPAGASHVQYLGDKRCRLIPMPRTVPKLSWPIAAPK